MRSDSSVNVTGASIVACCVRPLSFHSFRVLPYVTAPR
jgi:hypothetical protein